MADNKESLYNVSILIEDLRSDQSAVRVASMKRLNEIAGVLGEARTRDELIPYLFELIESDDEVLVAMAQQLGGMIAHVGGSAYVDYLIDILEKLCTMQEPTVRDEAVKAMLTICDALTPEEINEYIYPAAVRMHNGEWYTSKVCVCSLLPILYKVKQATGDYDVIVEMYDELCKDSAPMIRKAAISIIPEFIKVMDKDSCKVILVRSIYILVRDDQDSIRLCGNTSCAALATVLSEEDRIALLLPLFIELASDNSWRVRFTTVMEIDTICALFPKAIVETKLLPEFIRLLQDSELEVRTGAASNISKICKYLDTPVIIDEVVKHIEELSNDPSEFVRIGLAGDFLNICPMLGAEATEKYLLPVYSTLLVDTNTKVRLNIVSNFHKIKGVVSTHLLLSNLLPTLVALKNDMDWRVRQSLLNYIPSLSEQLGKEILYKELRPIICDYTTDSVSAIREDVVKAFESLYKLYGDDFGKDTLFPTVSDLLHHEKYTLRVTGLHILAATGKEMTTDMVDTKVFDLLVEAKSDPVANIRLNIAKTITALMDKFSPSVKKEKIIPFMTTFSNDKDRDVCYFAKQALSAIVV